MNRFDIADTIYSKTINVVVDGKICPALTEIEKAIDEIHAKSKEAPVLADRPKMAHYSTEAEYLIAMQEWRSNYSFDSYWRSDFLEWWQQQNKAIMAPDEIIAWMENHYPLQPFQG
jgi:hypothetical protein